MSLAQSDRMGTRGLSWGHEESLYLIELWSDETVQRDLDLAPKRNMHLFEKIRKEIQARVPEFDRTAEECRGRIKRLKRKYYDTRKSGSYQPACPYYEQLDAVLGSRPIPVFAEKQHAAAMQQQQMESYADPYQDMDQSTLQSTVNGGQPIGGPANRENDCKLWVSQE